LRGRVKAFIFQSMHPAFQASFVSYLANVLLVSPLLRLAR
jgi:hypothetical protein